MINLNRMLVLVLKIVYINVNKILHKNGHNWFHFLSVQTYVKLKPNSVKAVYYVFAPERERLN